jgi:pimeloyl-ACP methyl ester carboxylesterase
MDIWQRLHNLHVPLLIIRGSESDTFWAITAAKLKRVLPSAQIRTINEATHLVPLEKPESVSQEIISFLANIN